MERFKKVLYLAGHPPSERSFSCAVELARINDARLTVVSPVSPGRAGRRPGFESGSDHLREQLSRARRSELDVLTERGAAQGVRVEVRCFPDAAFPGVVHEVLRGEHDLLIKVADDDGGLRTRLLGSTDRQLIRTCPCPVWILDPAQKGRFDVVLAAVDVARDDPHGLGRKILELASSLARREGADLHVLHAWSMIGESILRSGMRGLGASRLERILERVRRERLRRLEELVESVPVADEGRLELEKGEAAPVIRSVVRRIGADVLVLGTVGRSGVEGLLLGNVAEEVLGRVHCSVLAVKPDGFTTPVELPDEADGTERSRGRPRRRRPGRPTPEERG